MTSRLSLKHFHVRCDCRQTILDDLTDGFLMLLSVMLFMRVERTGNKV